ncbi:MAG: cytidine deaminase [Spirochaetes bacterium]|nr:cytidine deaminase [Spirochaetota bacterium]
MEKITFEDLTDQEKELYAQAKAVRVNAYAPYSDFKVGASLLSSNENIFSGCNVESVDFTLTTHAEMNAIDTMVASGEQKIKTIVIVMEAESGYGMPCGLCRQKILEFALDNTAIFGINLDGKGEIRDIYKTSIKEVMPYSFGPEYLK